MESVAMLSNPELLTGIQELISDSDLVVVKRAIRVFSNLYHNAFRLVSSGELEEEILLKAWQAIKEVIDQLLAMMTTCENEGVILHLVRFLESAVTAHLMYDLSAKLDVAQKGREIIRRGLKALKDLITTPYVGGSVFILAVRALITIACHCPELHTPGTELIAKQMDMLPPTLFDHNVRSFHKMLQRNLFLLLKKVDSSLLKGKLVEMMVKAGVPRKMVASLAPAVDEPRKRSPVYRDDGRHSPPHKRVKLEAEEGLKQQQLFPAGIFKNMSPEEIVRASSDPRLISRSPPGRKSVSPPPNQNRTSKDENSNTYHKEMKRFSPEERELALSESLNLSNICDLIFQGLENLPSSLPNYFVKELDEKRLVHENLALMKKRLVALLYKEFSDEHLDSLVTLYSSDTQVESSKGNKNNENPTSQQAELQSENIPTSSSNSSTPCSTPPLTDVDLRRSYAQKPTQVSDVDMRIIDPRLSGKDPRITKNTSLRDPRLPPKDPDMRMGHSRGPKNSADPRDPRSANTKMDHRTQRTTDTKETVYKQSSNEPKGRRNQNKARDPRIRSEGYYMNQEDAEENVNAALKDPRLCSTDKRDRNYRKDPRMRDSEGSSPTPSHAESYENQKQPLLPLPAPLLRPMVNMDGNFSSGLEPRDPRERQLPKEIVTAQGGATVTFANDGGINLLPPPHHPLFPPNGNPMVPPHFPRMGPQGPSPLMANCPPMSWQGNFQGADPSLFLSQPVASGSGGFIQQPMQLNM